MQRFLGSPDIYGHKRREPQASVNFVTCHDGFTLNDLVSYDAQAQRGERRGQPRRQRPEPQLELRRRGPDRRPGDRGAARAPGPQLPGARPAGDGRPDAARWATRCAGRSCGNNNAYGHDDPLSWFDWTAVERQADLLRFTRGLIAAPPPGDRRCSPCPMTSSLLDLLAEASHRMGRRGARRAGHGPRLAQRRADRARRPGSAAPRLQRLLGAARVRAARARREHRWLAPARRHQPRIARTTSPSSGTTRREVGATDPPRRAAFGGRPGGAPGSGHAQRAGGRT